MEQQSPEGDPECQGQDIPFSPMGSGREITVAAVVKKEETSEASSSTEDKQAEPASASAPPGPKARASPQEESSSSSSAAQRRLRARRRRVGIHLPKSCVSNLGRSGGPAPKSRVQRRVPTRLNARRTEGKKSNGGSKVSGNGMSGITPRPRAVVPLLPQPILGQGGTGARIGKLMTGALGHGGSNQLRRQLSHPRLQATVKQAPGIARGPGLDLHPDLGEEMSLGPRVQVFLLVRTPPG